VSGATEFLGALDTLFGEEAPDVRGGLPIDWAKRLRATYRRRVYAVHPDRAAQLGRAEAELVRECQELNLAYELLSAVERIEVTPPPPPRPEPTPPPRRETPPPPRRETSPPPRRETSPPPRRETSPPPRRETSPPPRAEAPPRRETSPPPRRETSPPPRAEAPPRREPPPPRAAPPPPRAAPPPPHHRPSPAPPWSSSTRQTRRAPERFHDGPVPQRPLLFVEFLYYTGRISWQAFMAALSWQRAACPRLGRLAMAAGYMTQAEVAEVAEVVSALPAHGGRRFGEEARARGYLTALQVMVLLGRQRRMYAPIGEFFVESGRASAALRDAWLEAHRRHLTR
jgi:hypothetical protein